MRRFQPYSELCWDERESWLHRALILVEKPEQSEIDADAEGQREHGHGSEAGIFQQLAEGEAEVVKHG